MFTNADSDPETSKIEMIKNEARFDQLIQDAMVQDFSGWDFSYLDGRWQTEDLAWDYEQTVRKQISRTRSMLDMGTGGGEFLSSLAPLPEYTCATEAYLPNVPVAQKRLEPLGVTVYHIQDDKHLPFVDETFDLVINRHEAFWSDTLHRILKPRGWFVTQQVGGGNNLRLNQLFTGSEPEWSWALETATGHLHNSGFEIISAQEMFPEERFFDIGALVFYLKVISWQIPDFSVEKYHQPLVDIHNRIEAEGFIASNAHRFYIEAIKP